MKRAEPHPLLTLIMGLQQVADDPDQREAALRGCLRTVIGVLQQQHQLIEAQRRQLRWSFGPLAVMYFLLAGYQIGLLLWPWLKGTL